MTEALALVRSVVRGVVRDEELAELVDRGFDLAERATSALEAIAAALAVREDE
jgi:hypothetical protein